MSTPSHHRSTVEPPTGRGTLRAVSRLRALGLGPELVPGLAAVALFVFWGAHGGAFAPTTWYPGALLVLVLLGTALIMSRQWRRPHPVVFVALAALGAFTLWSFASIGWAEVKGDAWDGANRTLVYFTVFALFALPAWRAASAGVVLGAYSFGIAGIGLGTLITVSGAGDPSLSFLKGSLIDPTGYHNATAALFAPAAIIALHFGSRRETPWPLRGLLLSASTICAEMVIPAQSRGGAIVFPLALLVYFALVPGRVRALVALLPVAAATAIAAGPLLDIYSAAKNDAGLAGVVDDAASTVWLSLVFALVAGTVIGLADTLIEVPARVARGIAIGCAALAVAGFASGAVVALNATGNPVHWAEDRWDDFKGGYNDTLGSNRFSGSLGSNRYDFWRVGMDEFARHPLAGVGSDNFSVAYLRDRKSTEEPIHPHSLEVRVLSQTGMVGALLFVAFVVCAIAAAVRGLRRGTRFGRAIPAVSVAAFAYWLGHASGDWLWAFPALTAPAFAWLGLAGAVEEPTEPEPERRTRETAPRVGSDYDPHRRELSRGAISPSSPHSSSSCSQPPCPTCARSPPLRTS